MPRIRLLTAQRPTPNAQRPTPNAQRPTPNAQRPTPNAQRPTPNGECPLAISRTPTARNVSSRAAKTAEGSLRDTLRTPNPETVPRSQSRPAPTPEKHARDPSAALRRLGMTTRESRIVVTSHLSPLTSHLSPLTSHLSPLTSHLSPLTSHLSPPPLTSHSAFRIPHSASGISTRSRPHCIPGGRQKLARGRAKRTPPEPSAQSHTDPRGVAESPRCGATGAES